MSTESATVSAPKSSAKPATKGAPTESALVVALRKALAKAEKAKPAKVFDEAAFRKDMAKHGLPASFIDNATRESAKKWNAEHGDAGEQAARELLYVISPALGGIETLADVAGKMAKEEELSGKVRFTLTELEEEKKEGVAEFVKKASALWDAGKQTTEICEELKFYSYQTLFNFIKASPSIFAPRK
jgi:hypothetical protein